MQTKDLSFKRKEKKYIILEHTFDEIQEELSQHIPIHSYHDYFNITSIETTYLDTEDFLIFREYLLRKKFRFKLRLRRYGYGEDYLDHYWVELKIKYNSISLKRRFYLSADLLEAFLNGENLKSQIKESNKDLKGAQKTYKLVTQLISICDLKPVLKTSYERVAFQKKKKSIRLTIDRKISHKKLIGKNVNKTLDAIVLESKIMGKTPKWLKKTINELSLLNQKRFSKYATGINSLYFPERGKYNFYNDDNLAKKETSEKINKVFELLNSSLRLS